MSQGSSPKSIRCPCGNLMLYHDRDEDVAKFGLTVDEIADSTVASVACASLRRVTENPYLEDSMLESVSAPMPMPGKSLDVPW